MDNREKAPGTQQEAEKAGQRLLRTASWVAAAAVVTMLVAFCVLVLYLLGI
jgi:hypothetical protein